MTQIFLDRGLAIHILVYVAVNTLLVAIDLTGIPGKTWFFWPLLGWGIGIVGHATAVYPGAKKHAPPIS